MIETQVRDHARSRKTHENILKDLQIMVSRNKLATNHIRWAKNNAVVDEYRIADPPPQLKSINFISKLLKYKGAGARGDAAQCSCKSLE